MSLCHLDDVVGTPLSETCNGILTIIFGGPATPKQVQIGGWTPLQSHITADQKGGSCSSSVAFTPNIACTVEETKM